MVFHLLEIIIVRVDKRKEEYMDILLFSHVNAYY